MIFVSDIKTTVPTTNGTDTIITNGKNTNSLYDIIDGKQVGTLFLGKR